MDDSCSSDPDLPYITSVKHAECKFYNKLFNDCIINRTPKLLIFDLYRAKLEDETRFFKFDKYRFREVAIMGQVVCVQPHRDSFYFEVDDGTAQIRVYSTDYAETNTPVSHFDLSSCLMECEDLPADNINDVAKYLLIKAVNEVQNQVEPNDIICGDVVVFMGKLTEYEGQRNIFASNMYRINENTGQYRLDWFNDCLSSYNDNTSIFNSQWDEKYNIPEEMTCD